MSYILDALRKSETERRQGKVPDLGHQVQLIHRSKRKPVSPMAWLALALTINAAVLAVVFWPADNSASPTAEPQLAESLAPNPMAKQGTEPQTAGAPRSTVDAAPIAASDALPATGSAEPERVVADTEPSNRERPTIIVPQVSSQPENSVLREPTPAGRVPHLVELPLSFQKSIPDLTFNSHIFASDPYASRVMINSNYLRQGDSFSGLQVERITQEGVVLSKNGQRFRVGIVRDWVSPR